MIKKYLFLAIVVNLILGGSQKTIAQDHGHDEHGHDEHDGGAVHVSEDMQKIIGLSFENARMRSFEEKIKVYGEIAQDTDQYTHLTSDHDGIVKEVYVQAGSILDRNEPILSIAKNDGTMETVSAPHHGTIIALHVQSGDRVDHLHSLVSLAQLDKLRVSFDVYEKDFRFVSVGQAVDVRSTAFPDKIFKGKVVFVSPRIDKHTQTIRIRADVDNHDHLLRLGMFVTGDLIFTTGGEALSVSQSAVQQIDDEFVVFVPKEDEFESKEIKTGREFGDYVEVLNGLEEGQKIVSNGSFALKSELQKGAFGDGHNH
jgi:cobalt-zinc-cadmium efflux system membrane fusion protein